MRITLSMLICALLILPTTGIARSGGEGRIQRGNLVIEGIPEIPQRIKDRMLQYQNVRSSNLSDWHPAGKGILISTRLGETSQIHLVEMPGGARQQITFFNEPVTGARMCPNPAVNGFLFQKDVGGSENYQIFFFDLDDGAARMLTDGESRNGTTRWSNNGDRFSFHSTKRNGTDWDIYVADLEHPERAECVLENEGSWAAVDWSPDDAKLLVTRRISANESYYYVLDLTSKELTQINPTEKKIAYAGARFSKAGKGIYITSDEESEFQRLKYYDLESKEFTALTEEIPWDVRGAAFSKDGKFVAFVVNEDGISDLHLMSLESKTEQSLPQLPAGQIHRLRFSPDSKLLGMVLNTPLTPGDVYSLDLTTNELTRWTYSEVGGLQTDNFITPELIHYKTFDKVDGKQRMIPAFYYRPDKKGSDLFPVLISIHGGPESQYRPFFNSSFQYYLNELGIAVIAPNVRGSSGYGKSYLQLDNGFNREQSVKDVGSLLDWIAGQAELDENRVAVIGGSYGGYMVLASMTRYNDRLRAGIERVGISNFVTFLENTKSYRRDRRRVEYGDERDPEMREYLIKISPTTNAHKITKPMFIAQGLNDPRVPASESEQIVEVIRKNDVEVWYVLAKDEGHGFRKKSNRDFYSNAVVLFLEQMLVGDKGVRTK